MSLRDGRFLVLGGAGFIGKALCNRLASEGAVVRAYGRQIVRPSGLAPDVEWIQGDLVDDTTLAAALKGNDFVVHAAGNSVPATADADPAYDLIANVAPTIRLFQQCRAAGITRVLYISSGGTVYGKSSRPSKEDDPRRPVSAYGASKVTIETYVDAFHQLWGLEYVILRVSNVFGPGQRGDRPQGLVAVLMDRMLNGAPITIWGDGSAVRDYVYIDDLVDALCLSSTYCGRSRALNIGSGEGRSVSSVISDIAAALNVHPELVFEVSRGFDVGSVVLDITLARTELGWSPATSWRKALATTVERRIEAAP